MTKKEAVDKVLLEIANHLYNEPLECRCGNTSYPAKIHDYIQSIRRRIKNEGIK